MVKPQESILDLASSVDKPVTVHFNGGRVCTGTLKGYDELVNLVLSDTTEYILDPSTMQPTDETRKLGLIVCRGTQVQRVVGEEGREEIENPFEGESEDEEENA